MSGGAFDYKCHTIADFARDLQYAITHCKLLQNRDDDFTYEYDRETKAALIGAQRVIESAGEIARSVEWYFSGDFSDDILVATCRKHFDKIITAITESGV